ncbi:nitroreductase family protein [Maribacter sp. 2307ULW6-5]|uniref:nitroreductase family protein n=1 Tax=Maribacter sp. 2307ULW6-5 TaxID=3386275 RepID=UPI0039BCA2F6
MKTVEEAINYRRSTRIFKENTPLDSDKVRHCLELASLAPNSSNLQLWEFYHIEDPEMLKRLSVACLGQNAAKTAKQMVVVVVRKDLWKRRAKANVAFLKRSFGDKGPKEYGKREKMALDYYQKLIPTLYFDVFGFLGWLKWLVFKIVGWFRPIYKEVRRSDMRIVAHKSAALAAQNFMLSMAALDYDTCPMEGSDTDRVKRILGLPWGAEINMVIGCGVREEKGIYGPRFRVPFEDVYRKK